MYKDKEKQREANKKAAQRLRDKKQGITPKDAENQVIDKKNSVQNAPESTNSVIPEPSYPKNHTQNVIPNKFPLTHKDAVGNDNHTDYEYRRTLQLEHVRNAKGGGTVQQEKMSKLHLMYQMLKGPKLQNYLGLDLTPEQLEKQGYYWPYWLTENAANRDRDKEGRVKVA